MAFIRRLSSKLWEKLFLALLLFNVVFFLSEFINFDHPYNNVEAVDIHRNGEYLYVTYNFNKLGCERKRFSVLGYTDDVSQFLEWEGLDGVESDYDREIGPQTLRGRIFLGDLEPDTIALKTRHICNGKRIDKVFATIKQKDMEP